MSGLELRAAVPPDADDGDRRLPSASVPIPIPQRVNSWRRVNMKDGSIWRGWSEREVDSVNKQEFIGGHQRLDIAFPARHGLGQGAMKVFFGTPCFGM